MLRICTVVGTSERGAGAVASFLKAPCGLVVSRHDCELQFIAEEDLIPVFFRALEADHFRGIYNIAPDDYTTVGEISGHLKRFTLRVPYPALYGAFYLLRRLTGNQWISENAVDYLTYPIVVDNARIRGLSVRFRYGSRVAFLRCAKALREKLNKNASALS